MGKTRIADVYLARKATINIGKTKYKNFEFFFKPIINVYITHIENATPETSIAPETAQEYTNGNEMKIKLPIIL
jgi:hypothetical protein